MFVRRFKRNSAQRSASSQEKQPRKYSVNRKVDMQDHRYCIELAGTGYIQLIQIFCYVLLFDPGILLIDEPDIHLHPHIQERLVVVLAEVARERGVKILLTTHSLFIICGAPPVIIVCWWLDGYIESQNLLLLYVALGWGSFGKKLIIVSE